MKYNAEVDRENRNISPRNDLLRKRKCVGIIQAAEARTQGHVYALLATMERSRCVPTLVAGVRVGRGLNEPSGYPGLRQRGEARRGESEVGLCPGDPNKGIPIPFLW